MHQTSPGTLACECEQPVSSQAARRLQEPFTALIEHEDPGKNVSHTDVGTEGALGVRDLVNFAINKEVAFYV